MPSRQSPALFSSFPRLLQPAPPDQWHLTEALWLRALGLIYFFAFWSFALQINGLNGSRGISPATQLFDSVHRSLGARAFWAVPSLLWFWHSDAALEGICVAGCVFGVVLMAGFLPRISALLCFAFYLSIVTVGQPFSNFQWDALLLEAGFLAMFAGTPLVAWAYRFLLFRLMFESGVVKLTSHDPNWRNMHALRFHFTTQPLPTPLAYYAQRLPDRLLDACTALMFSIELVAPFLLFGPRPFRRVAGSCIILLQVAILLTGNYAFFNLLTIALALWAFDDPLFARWARAIRTRARPVRHLLLQATASSILSAILLVGAIQLFALFKPSAQFRLQQATQWMEPFEVVNSYGLFAVMTTTRPEVIIEGSNDGQTWREYRFRYKPGDLRRGPQWVAPYQPRLDWQMWFAALGSYQGNPWTGALFFRLLTDPGEMGQLLEAAPFPKPPHYLRALLYEYSFTEPAERAKTGNVWTRKLVGTWFGPVAVRTKGQDSQ